MQHLYERWTELSLSGLATGGLRGVCKQPVTSQSAKSVRDKSRSGAAHNVVRDNNVVPLDVDGRPVEMLLESEEQPQDSHHRAGGSPPCGVSKT